MDRENYIQSLIIRLLQGEEISVEEKEQIVQWVNADPKNRRELAQFDNVWNHLEVNSQLSDKVINQQWNRFVTGVIEKPVIKKRSIKAFWTEKMRYAAVFMMGLTIASASYLIYHQHNKHLLSQQFIEVPYGGKSNIYLADGTEVILNAGSKLTYSTEYGDKERAVKLDGEAYFNVVTDAEKPFTVETSHLTVRAYGTMFNVKSYSDDNIIETTLIEGRVSVQKNMVNEAKASKEFFLEPNEQITYHKAINTEMLQKKEKLFISRNIEVDLSTAWVNDRINLKSELLSELVIRLQRKYNVNIHYDKDELGELRFSGVLENETIGQVMKAIQLTAPVEFKIKNRDIWITKREEIQNTILTN